MKTPFTHAFHRVMSRKSIRHFRFCLGFMTLLVTTSAMAQTKTMVGQNSTGCAADSVNPACRSGTASSSSSSSSGNSGYSSGNSAARTEAIANGVETLINIFTADSARKQQERREWEEQSRQFREEQANSKSLFDSMAPAPQSSRTVASSGRSSSANPWASGKDERSIGDLTRPQCLEIQRPPKTGGYIGDLKVYNKCDEAISYSYCYRGGGRSSWNLFECKPDAQGHLSKGSSDIAPGATAVLPETLSSTTVELAVCKKGALPFITNVNGRQSSFICR